jgi:hypothetical protein
MLAAITHASVLNADVWEVNIPTIEQDEHTLLNDLVLIPKLIYGLPTFFAAVYTLLQEIRDIFCR